MQQFDDGSVQYLDNIGELGLGVDKASHELVIMLKTPVGLVSSSLTKERALQLGIALVRYSGQTFRFENPPVVGPPPELTQENEDAKNSCNGGGPGFCDGLGRCPARAQREADSDSDDEG